MIKNSNPFITLIEAQARLATLGADPTSRNPYAGSVDWREHILSITMDALYEHGSRFFTCKIHLTNEGFDAVVQLLNSGSERFPVAVRPYHGGYVEHYINPSPLLRLFTLAAVPCAPTKPRKEDEGK